MWMRSGHLNRIPPDGLNLRIPFSHSSGKVQDQRVAGLVSSEVSLLGLHTLAASSHGHPSLCVPLVSLHLLKGPPHHWIGAHSDGLILTRHLFNDHIS